MSHVYLYFLGVVLLYMVQVLMPIKLSQGSPGMLCNGSKMLVSFLFSLSGFSILLFSVKPSPIFTFLVYVSGAHWFYFYFEIMFPSVHPKFVLGGIFLVTVKWITPYEVSTALSLCPPNDCEYWSAVWNMSPTDLESELGLVYLQLNAIFSNPVLYSKIMSNMSSKNILYTGMVQYMWKTHHLNLINWHLSQDKCLVKVLKHIDNVLDSDYHLTCSVFSLLSYFVGQALWNFGSYISDLILNWWFGN